LRQRLGLSEAQLLQYATVRRIAAPSGEPEPEPPNSDPDPGLNPNPNSNQVRRLVAPSGMPASGAPYDEAAAARGDASHLLVGVSGGGGAGGEPPWLSVVPRG